MDLAGTLSSVLLGLFLLIVFLGSLWIKYGKGGRW
jgi:cbb3-type cytochrome oxidase subunit 3